MIKGPVVKTEKEYRKIDRLSSSDLRLFANDRRKFFKEKILGEKPEEEEYNKSLLIGDLVHTLLLSPHTFDDKFLMSICSSPPTGLMLAFTEALYKHTVLNTTENGEVTKDFAYLAEAAYKDSGFKLPMPTVINRFRGSTAEDYYNELRLARSTGRIVVCVDDTSIAEKIVEKLLSHPFTQNVFGDKDEDIDIYDEWKGEEFEIRGIPMKMMSDKLKANRRERTVQPYDLKIVWDNQNFYREYYLKKRADIQALVYYEGIKRSLEKINKEYKDYTVLPPIFVVADSSNFYSPLKYQLTEKDLDMARDGFEYNGRRYKGVTEIIEEIKWSQETGNWGHSQEEESNFGFKNLT